MWFSARSILKVFWQKYFVRKYFEKKYFEKKYCERMYLEKKYSERKYLEKKWMAFYVMDATSETGACLLGKVSLHSSAATTFSKGFSPNTRTHNSTPRLHIWNRNFKKNSGHVQILVKCKTWLKVQNLVTVQNLAQCKTWLKCKTWKSAKHD